MASGQLSAGDAVAVAGMLTMGTFKTLLNKLMYGIQARGVDGSVHNFEKPGYMCANMFIGMSGCLLPSLVVSIAFAAKRCGSKRPPSTDALRAPLLGEDPLPPSSGPPADDAAEQDTRRPVAGLKGLLVISAPTIADLLATCLSNVGLLYITVSVYQMLRGAVILWNTLFGVLYLGKRLNKLHYGGLVLAVVGIVVVGAASLLTENERPSGGHGGAAFAPPPPGGGFDDFSPPPPSPDSAFFPPLRFSAFLSPGARSAALAAGNPAAASSTWALIGMAMIIASQAVQAAGMTLEEFLLRSYSLSSTQLVGYEGAVGLAMMCAFFLPLAALLPGHDVGGVYENSEDTVYMIFHSRLIGGLLAIDLLAINLFNAAGMRITSSLGAVFRSVLEAVRTLNVWLIDLLLYYYFTGGKLGERWSPRWSPLQAAGFAILVASALTYGKGNMRNAADAAAAAEAAAAEEGAATSVDGAAAAPAEGPFSAAAAAAAASPAPSTPAPLSGAAVTTPPLLPSSSAASSSSRAPVLPGRSTPRFVTPRAGDGGSTATPGTPRSASSLLAARQMSLGRSAAVVGSPMLATRFITDT